MDDKSKVEKDNDADEFVVQDEFHWSDNGVKDINEGRDQNITGKGNDEKEIQILKWRKIRRESLVYFDLICLKLFFRYISQ